MTYILVFWTIVGYAGAGTQYSRDWKKEYDWRPIGEFQNYELCLDAARQLVISPDKFRCIRSK